MTLWVWQQLRVELPDGWEMLQFSRDPAAGRCGFADRYQFRLELDWRAAPSPPDLARMESDYLAKLRHDGTMPDAKATAAGERAGIVGTQAGLPTSRFGRYVAEVGCIVEVVFLWPDGRDEALEGAVLASLGPEPERDGLRRWRAFGMDLLASAGLTLTGGVMQPARAQLAFADKARGREETFLRLGMVSEWLGGGDVAAWLARQTPRDAVRPATARSADRGHEIETLAAVRKPALLRAARRYASEAWLCPADGRLYCVSVTGGEDGRLAGRRLSCCGELELPR